MTSSPPCWWTETKDLSLPSFVRHPEVVHFSVVIGVPREWLKTSYTVVYVSLEERQLKALLRGLDIDCS